MPQPLIAPLFGGLTEIEVLARIAGASVTDPYAIVRETFAGLVSDADKEAAWRKFLHDGFLANSAAKPVDVKLNHGAVSQSLNSLKVALPAKDKLDVVIHRDYSLDDGRSWSKYTGNPILDLQLTDFRDPDVSWDEARQRWTMSVALPQKHIISFYHSQDLKHWSHDSDFGPAGEEPEELPATSTS